MNFYYSFQSHFPISFQLKNCLQNLYNISLVQKRMNRPKYLIGTLFQEEEIDQKQNANTLKNKDPMGNTRWQGAFTGGFSAGYRNTCGSKQGWQPAQFVSSISKRAERKDQNVKDFMDKEDLGKQSITQNIQLNNTFSSQEKNPFNIGVKQSIGQKIWAKIKKQTAMDSVPENQQDLEKLLKYYEHEENIEKETQKANYILKDLQKPYSVGGNEFNCEDDEFIENYQQLYRRVIRATVKQQTEQERQKRIEQNKIYFDFTKPIEQQPQYLKQIHEIEDLQKLRKRKKNLLNMLKLKDIFSPAIQFKQFKEESTIEKVPQDYDPYHRIRNIKDFLYKEKKRQEEEIQLKPKHRIHSIQQRQDILGTEKLSNKFRSASTTFIKGNQNQNQPTKKFFQNEKKNQRYIDYVDQLQGRKIACQNQYLSYQQAQKERHQFQAMYQKQKQDKNKNTKMIPQQKVHEKQGKLPDQLQKILAQKKEQSNKLTIQRTIKTWRPSQALCKRFGCLLPYKIQEQSNSQKQQYF